ncbi:MAG TPA: HEAT repeat domain-containing protein [Candidatus Kryptonia bacterium]|nr:HEAT repeat domain-containing protein [Candidatus Kryptonia bacterium]
MTRSTLRRGTPVAGFLLVLVSAQHYASAESPPTDELLRAGRYQEAYDAAVANGKAEPIAALAQTARALLAASLQSSDSYQQWYGLRAAQPLEDKQVADSVRALARSDDRYVRSLAIEMLATQDPVGSRDELLAALDSPFRSVRLRALRGLTTLRDQALAERFREILSADSDPDLRAFAARGLAEMGGPEATAGLYRALDDPMSAVQEEVVRALVALHDPGIADVMRRRLADHPPELAVRVIRLAGLVPDRDLVRDIGPFLADPNPEVRAYAAGSILSILEHTRPPKR